MRRTAHLLCCAAAMSVAGVRAVDAQEALVLSGGGSRGLAHVGVLQGLGELGYDPDLVVGMSIGAVVGALYAAGYDPGEIRRRILDVDWNRLFAATPLVIGSDRTVRHPMLSLDLDVSRLRVSRGLVGQWRINRALARILFDANARSRGDFDRLARGYRAIAADLKTGEVVVLAGGDLARAARASMAVPGFFAPVEWDGRVLVDGAIADDLPLSAARGLGATHVIASDVSRARQDIHSQAPLAVVQRALDLMQANMQRDSTPPDVLVLPDIEPGFSGATFPADPTPLIELGLAAARRDVPPATTASGIGERPLPPPPDSFTRVAFEAPDRALEGLARSAFAGVAPGAYDADAVLSAMDHLYTTGLFEAVWPRVEETPAGATELLVRLEGAPPLSLAGAAGYENDRGGRLWASLDRYAPLGGFPAVFGIATRLDGLERWGTLSARVHSFRRTPLTWSLGTHLQERNVRFFVDDGFGAKEVLRLGGWVALEVPHVLRDRLAAAVLRADWIEVEDEPDGAAWGPLLRYASVNPDARVVGMPFLLEAEHRWGALSYSRIAAAGSRTVTLGGVQAAALVDVRAVSRDAPSDVRPTLGDDHAVPGLRWGEHAGRGRAVAGLDVAWPVFSGFARLRLRTGAAPPDELDDLESWQWITGLQAGAFWQSPIGVIEAGYGIATRGDGRFDVNVGRAF